jgi:hypothetical protein
MVKLSLVLAAIAATAGLGAAQGTTRPKSPSAAFAQQLLRQENSGPDGLITRRVHCGPGSHAGLVFSCQLVSVRSTKLRADLADVGGELRTTWEPIAG